ncbi:MAG: DUF3429 domain-containing protein [Gammaproteobacteria bacterium]|nr:MAG: DUF3429 domain-containing protein [Gammaproteobacteria bacterium]
MAQAQDSHLVQSTYAKLLGYAGAGFIPLLLVVSLISPELAGACKRLSLIYGAVILGFLGGIQWGIALGWGTPRVALRRLCVSMVPPLWAVMALSLPVALCTVLLVVGLVTLLVYEWLERGDVAYPPWYLPLRLQLTAVLSVSLAATMLI